MRSRSQDYHRCFFVFDRPLYIMFDVRRVASIKIKMSAISIRFRANCFGVTKVLMKFPFLIGSHGRDSGLRDYSIYPGIIQIVLVTRRQACKYHRQYKLSDARLRSALPCLPV